jgi:hypothetical protein
MSGLKSRDETAYPDRDPFAVSPLYGTSNSLRPIPFFQFIIRIPTVSKVPNIVLIKKQPTRCIISQLYFGKYFEKWCILLAFIIRMYHNARSSLCKICQLLTASLPGHFTTGVTGPYPCCWNGVGLQRQRGRRGARAISVLAWNKTPILLLFAHSLDTVLKNL